MPDRCRNCPVPAGSPCHALTAPAPRLCAKVDPGSGAYDPRYAAVVVRMSAGPDGAVEPPPASRLAAGESLRRIKLARACEHRTESVPCGCSGLARCMLGKGREGIVSLSECVDCLAGLTPGGPPRS